MRSQGIDRLCHSFHARLEDLFGEHLKHTILYGSYARNGATEGSDIDIMVLVDFPRKEIVDYRRAVASIAGDFLLSDGILISASIENEAFFNAKKDVLPFYRNILCDGKLIGV